MLSAQAQTQRGYVKTLGRPDKAGEPLPGVTIRVKGEHNPVISNEEGIFLMEMAGKKNGEAYSLQQVQKNGYELNENGLIGRLLAFSDKVPLTIVMVSSAQLNAEKERIENIAYKTAEKNYNTKFKLLERQLNDNEIIIEQYREEIQDLQNKFERYLSLIDGLAEHYAHTDYDLLDEKDREITICIENGELERADSLIKTIFNPIDVLQRNVTALSSIEQQIVQAHGIIDQANDDMVAVLKQQEKDAEYLYQLFTIALARFENEKALNYIETRAELDSTNPGWQFDAGYCFQEHNDFLKAQRFYSRALDIYRRLAKENPKVYEPDLATTLNNLAILYKNTQRFTESESLYLEALESYRRLAKEKPKEYEPFIARTLNNLAILFSNTQRLAESENMYLEALEIRRRLAKGDPQTYEPGLATTLNNLAILYSNTQRIQESETLLIEALEIRKRLAKDNPKVYEPDLAMTMNNLAVLYANTQRFQESQNLHLEVLEIYRRLVKDNPQAYEPVLATTLNNLAILYKNTQRYIESESLHLEALEIDRRLAKDDPKAYEHDVAKTLNNLADLYFDTQRLAESEAMRLESLDIYRHLAIENPHTFEHDLAMTLNSLALLYSNTQRITESEALYQDALGILRRLALDNPKAHEPDLAMTLNHIADLYFNTQRIAESETLYLESLEIYRRLVTDTPQAYEPYLASILSSLAILYHKTERQVACETMHLEALEIYRRMARNNPRVYEPRLATTLYSVGLLHWQEEQHSQAIPYFEEALTIYRALALQNPSYQKWYENSLNFLTQYYQMKGEHAKYIIVNEERIPILRKHFIEDAESYQKDYLNALGNQSLHSIFENKLIESEQYAREILSIDSTQIWVYSNIAASLLFQGKFAEAEAIYRQYKNELKDSFLQDFIDFEAAGIIPEERKADVERIRQMLME